jgi:hypothetical protein
MPNELNGMNNDSFHGGGIGGGSGASGNSGYGGGFSGGGGGGGGYWGGASAGHPYYSRPGQPGGYSTPQSAPSNVWSGSPSQGPARPIIQTYRPAPVPVAGTAAWRNLNLENAYDPYRAYYSLDATRGTAAPPQGNNAPPSISGGGQDWHAGDNWGNYNGNNNYGSGNPGESYAGQSRMMSPQANVANPGVSSDRPAIAPRPNPLLIRALMSPSTAYGGQYGGFGK